MWLICKTRIIISRINFKLETIASKRIIAKGMIKCDLPSISCCAVSLTSCAEASFIKCSTFLLTASFDICCKSPPLSVLSPGAATVSCLLADFRCFFFFRSTDFALDGDFDVLLLDLDLFNFRDCLSLILYHGKIGCTDKKQNTKSVWIENKMYLVPRCCSSSSTSVVTVRLLERLKSSRSKPLLSWPENEIK